MFIALEAPKHQSTTKTEIPRKTVLKIVWFEGSRSMAVWGMNWINFTTVLDEPSPQPTTHKIQFEMYRKVADRKIVFSLFIISLYLDHQCDIEDYEKTT